MDSTMTSFNIEAGFRPDRLPDAELPGPFAYGDQHDVANPHDTSHQGADTYDPDEEQDTVCHRIEHTDLIAGHPHTDGILVCRVEYVLTGHIRPEPVLEILALFFGGDPVYRKVNGAEPEAFIIKLLRYGKRYICGRVVTLVVIIIDTNNLIHHIAAFHVFTQRVLVTE